jgi:hypothetical protein
MKRSNFLAITPCTPLKVSQSFEGTFRLHLQGSSIACYPFYAGFLLGLLFDPEDGGDMSL